MSNTWKPIPGAIVFDPEAGQEYVYRNGEWIPVPPREGEPSPLEDDTPPVWAYEGPATVDVYGGGLLALRLDAPDIPQGPPERGEYTIRLELVEVIDE